MNIIFVCTGNTCRSPMGEYIMQDRLKGKSGCHVSSMGTFASDGRSPSANAINACKESGINITGHLSRKLVPMELRNADYIFCMEPHHMMAVSQEVPEVIPALTLLDPKGISDPHGGDIDEYRKTFKIIAKNIDEILPELFHLRVKL